MGLDIHGVNKVSILTLSNYSLTVQIFLINLLISLLGFLFFVFFNIYLIQNDKKIFNDFEFTNQNLFNIKNKKPNNAINKFIRKI